MTENERAAHEKARDAEYLALPPIQRIKNWHAYTCCWSIGLSFAALGQALHDWAEEQEKK